VDAQQKKRSKERARVLLHETLFEMRRMDFTLITALVSTADPTYQMSDLNFHHLKRQAKAVLKRIEDAEKELKPFLEKRLVDGSL